MLASLFGKNSFYRFNKSCIFNKVPGCHCRTSDVYSTFKYLRDFISTVFYLFNIAKNSNVYGYCNLDWVVFIN